MYAKSKFFLISTDLPQHQVTCNPVGQALVLNENKTDMNIILGVCIGHDMLFRTFSEGGTQSFRNPFAVAQS